MNNLYFEKIVINPEGVIDLNSYYVLHGIGTDEKALQPMIKHLNHPGVYYFIRGPFRYGINGYACFEVKFSPEGNKINIDQAQESLKLLKEFVDTKKNVSTKNIFMGFSQGAIMSYAMAFQFPDLVDEVIGLNGRVLKEFEAIKPNGNKKIKINAVYGLYDEIQPMHYANEAKERFKLDWIDLNYFESPCAHEINLESLNFVKKCLG